MRRRLTLAIAGMALVTLVLSGIGTLLLAKRAAADDTRRQTQVIARAVARATANGHQVLDLRLIRTAARLDGAAFLPINARGGITGSPPSGLTLADLSPARLLAGDMISGTSGPLIFAAVKVQVRIQPTSATALPRLSQEVVVLTRQVPPVSFTGGYLILAAAILGLSVLIAVRLSRRITKPLTQAVATTRLIAGGDLEAQVAVGRSDYPELASLGHSINSMAESLGRARGQERQFLLSVSHDLRTPLTSIQGYAEAIADGTATDAVRAGLVIVGEARRLERLVGDLLELAKLNARRFSLAMRRVDVAEVVADVAEGFRPSMDAAGLDYAVEVTPERGLWAGVDPDRLAQVLANLIENAFKFAGRSIIVTAGTDGTDTVVITVTDDGAGIAPENLPHVFDRHFTADSGQPGGRPAARQAGSGLGLAIVAELLSAMKATVRAESPTIDGHGTRMVVALADWKHVSAQV